MAARGTRATKNQLALVVKNQEQRSEAEWITRAVFCQRARPEATRTLVSLARSDAAPSPNQRRVAEGLLF